MEFEVTATRKRPQSLMELSGQDFVVATLKNSIESGRIAHAYLFSGPRGVGKTSSARILARSLNCEKGPSITPCGVCSNCVEIARGNSMDVIEIDGASNTSVNDIREIKDEVLFGPGSSRYKIYIIDEVHMLSNSAFNALLKTIEEPPPYIIFIFATTEIHKVPATIRSRCQQFNFRLVELGEIKRLLANVCDEIAVKYDEDALFWIARESTGSVRDAYTLFDQIVSFSEGHLSLDKIREKLGLIGMDQLNNLMTHLVEEKTNASLDLLDCILSGGVSVEQFIVDLAEYLRNILFIFHGVRKESLLGYTEDRFSSAVFENLNSRQIEWALEEVITLFRNIRYSLNPRFELELLVSRLSSIRYHIDPKALLEELSRMKEQLGSSNIQISSSGEEIKKKLKIPETVLSDAFDQKLRERHSAPAVSAAKPNEAEAVSASSNPPAPPVINEKEERRETPTVRHTENQLQNLKEIEDAPGEIQQETVQNEPLPPLPEFREKVLIALRQERHSLAAAMDKSGSWDLDGSGLTLSFNSPFESTFIEKESREIEAIVKKALGWSLHIKTIVKHKKEEDLNQEVEEQVELVRNIFRGTLINRS
ncbi:MULTISPECIES: DNA polymerase III subunit gamma/tau [unclassified Oceanispirochaeta]|nr:MULTISPECIES: DNA polymerase III subunit gamma/tau [unclassified Oceanispirochaeta]MBF9015226.1 DNA polymerase III subunit gamma/tau [Oceanispirochaeta sp. M2]NPD71684.1 DNA polymerase III subunit gamma/tau [Oceanispirochaeta sp. M1]RDG33013.1 DNA polymerase III subunit gamma/tau [Oceanispirochaeta sp. M1]